MKIVFVFVVLLPVLVGAQEMLVPPPQLLEVAKAHHCQPVISFVADEESSQISLCAAVRMKFEI
jgi:hypothetical protein